MTRAFLYLHPALLFRILTRWWIHCISCVPGVLMLIVGKGFFVVVVFLTGGGSALGLGSRFTHRQWVKLTKMKCVKEIDIAHLQATRSRLGPMGHPQPQTSLTGHGVSRAQPPCGPCSLTHCHAPPRRVMNKPTGVEECVKKESDKAHDPIAIYRM
jgi:hypothetical protein